MNAWAAQLVNVLRFMRDKPDQISGWSDDIACADLYDTFCAVLRRERPDVLDDALKALKRTARKGVSPQHSVWNQVTKVGQTEGSQIGFSFGFEVDDGESEGEAE